MKSDLTLLEIDVAPAQRSELDKLSLGGAAGTLRRGTDPPSFAGFGIGSCIHPHFPAVASLAH